MENNGGVVCQERRGKKQKWKLWGTDTEKDGGGNGKEKERDKK